MTSTNDGKDVKSNQISGQKAKTYYIELYKTLDSRLSGESELEARTSHLCEAWRRVHCLCLHSASTTHPHLISWLQRHTAQTLLQSEWQKNVDKQKALEDAIDFFIDECEKGAAGRASPHWEVQLLQRAQWFKKVIPDPWGNSVLKALLGLPDASVASSTGEGPTDQEILEWLKEERGVFFVTRLRQLGTSNCSELTKVALKLASAVMDRVRACTAHMSDGGDKVQDHTDKEGASKSPTFLEILTKEAGFTIDILELITDIEFVLLHKDQSKCIDLAKQTPLNQGYQLVERLYSRLELSPREKRLWKNSKKVATLIAQVMVARCMVVGACAGVARAALYGCARALVKLLPGERLRAAMAALAAPAATARHLHTLAHAVHSQCKNERKPFVCELYIRAITTGMNELERLKLNKEKESEARAAEQTLSSWFTQLGSLLGESARLAYECALTAFSVHPSRAMYDRICAAPTLQPHPGQTSKDVQEPAEETNKEFGSWATDSRSQTNFVKTSETLNLKKIQQQSNVLSTAILNEGETLGLSPELCQDLIVLLSGPRVKTLSWDMDKEILIENCRSYMERTHGGTKALTTELKYLNLNPDSFNHLPEEEDEDEGDIYYGIEKGYEHLVEIQDPEEIWKDAFPEAERSEICYSTDEEIIVTVPRRKKKPRRLSETSDEDEHDPLSLSVTKQKPRSHSEEGSKDKAEHRSTDKKKKERHKKEKSARKPKKKDKEEIEPKPNIETDPLTLEAEPLQPKPKKERKKREKKEKKEKKVPKEKKIPKKKTPLSSALSRLIGKKVIRVNAHNTQPKISATATDTDFNNQLFVSDSDYDSQGKSSVASMHTEGNDPDVLFDGLYSMDEIKSPEKTSTAFPDKPKKIETPNRETLTKPMNVPTGFSIMNSHYLSSGTKTSKQKPPAILMSSKNYQLPPPQYAPYFKNDNEDVKLNIKRLLEFRRQKSATDLYSDRKIVTKPEPYFHKSATNRTVPHKYVLPNTVENELRIQSGCPKAISVPNIPKVFINKQQSEQINVLKNEVESYLSYMNKNPVMETTQTNAQIGRPESRLNNEQSSSKSIRPVNAHLNNAEQKVFNTPRHNAPVKVIDNVASNPALRSLLNTKPTDPKENVSTLEPNFQEFLKDLQRSINAGVCTTEARSSGNASVNESPSSPTPINYSAKQTKPQKKVENAPNTFARRNYMHKNKQGETMIKQNNDQVTQNRLHSRPVEPKKVVNILSDTIISPGDRSVIKKIEKTTPRQVNSPTDSIHSKNILNMDQCVIRRPVALDEKLTKRSISTPAQPTNFTAPRSTMLTDNDQNQLLLLLRQQSKLNITRPQIRENVINKVPSTLLTPTSSCAESPSSALNVQNAPYTYSGAENIHNQLKACQGLHGLPIQPNQNVSVPIENAAIIQPRSSSIIKVPETSKPDNLQQKSITGNDKKIRHPKGELKITTEPQDWQSVMDALSAQKTPSRGLNALDMVLQKDSYRKQFSSSNTVHDQQLRNSDPSCNLKTNVTVISNANRKDESILNSKIPSTTSLANTKNVISSRNNLPTSSNVPSVMINKLPVQTDTNLLRKNNQPLIVKRINKAQVSSGASKKGVSGCGSETSSRTTTEALKKHMILNEPEEYTDPMLSDALPTFSDYDLLEELMDDDLRQEIGELLSDEDNFSSTNTVLKSIKVKSDNRKPISADGSRVDDVSRNSNIRQNVCKLSKQTHSVSCPDTTIFTHTERQTKHTVTSVQTSFENTRIKKSKPAPNTTTIHDNVKNTMIIHDDKLKNEPVIQTTTMNIINNAPSSVIMTRNIQANPHPVASKIVIDNQREQLISKKPSNIIHTPNLSYVEQNSTVNGSNPVHANSLRPTMTTIQNSGAIYTAVTHQPMQNVVLIRPEIVYEPYVQVHGSNTHFNSNTFVAVPNIPIYGAQLASPVIIASPVAVSNIENKIPFIDTAPRQDTCEANKNVPEKCYSVESSPIGDIIDSNKVEKTNTSPHCTSFEQGVMLGDLINSNLKTDTETKTCYVNTKLEKKDVMLEQTEPIISKTYCEAEHENKREILKVPKHINSNPPGVAKVEIKRNILKTAKHIVSKASGVGEDEIKNKVLKVQKDLNVKTSDISENEINTEILKVREHINSNPSNVARNEIKRKILKTEDYIKPKPSGSSVDKIKKEIHEAREHITLKKSGISENEMKTEIPKAREFINSKNSGVTEDLIEREILGPRNNTNLDTIGISKNEIRTDIRKAQECNNSKTSSVTEDENKTEIREAREKINLKASFVVEDKIKIKILDDPEQVNSKGVGEDDSKKEILKIREERLKKKRMAILQRQTIIASDSKPIPLSYTPISKVNLGKDNKKTNKTNANTGQANKRPAVIALGYNAMSNQIMSVTGNVLSNNTEPIKDQEKNNTSKIILKNVPKGNKESDKIEVSGVALRSSKKSAANTPILIIPQKLNNEKEKSDSGQTQSMDTSKGKTECETRTLRSSNKFIQNKLLQNQKDDEKNSNQPTHKAVNQSSLIVSANDSNKIEVESNRSTLRSSNRSVIKSAVRSQSEKPNKNFTIDAEEDKIQQSDMAKLTDSLKENNKIEEKGNIPIIRTKDNSAISCKLPIKNTPKKIFKTKVRLNLKSPEKKDDLEIKRFTKQKVQKIVNKGDKSVKQQKSNLNPAFMTANDLQNLDIEEQLSGSIILKTDSVGNLNAKSSEEHGNADLLNTSINKTKEKETSSKNSTDTISKRSATIRTVNVNSSINCNGNVSLQNEKPLKKSSVTEKLEGIKENVASNLSKKSDTNEITPYVKLVSSNIAYHECKETENNVTDNINLDTLSCNKSISLVNGPTARTNTVIQEVKQSNDLKNGNDVSSVKEICSSMSSREPTTKVTQDAINERKEFVDSLKDKITIKELPRKETDDPLKRCISIKLSNGNSFKATVSGKLHIDIDSLFEDPAIRSVLLNNVPSNARCILNVQQVGSMKSDKIKTKLVYPEKKNLETINLISDDEDDNEKPQVVKTEFGIFNIKGLNNSILNQHQNKFLQKCSVIVERCKVPLKVQVENNTAIKEDSSTVSKSNSQDLSLSQICNSVASDCNSVASDKEIIEIDDSSNESVNVVGKPFDVQQFTIPEHIDKNLKELKETLLQDLCVDEGDSEQNNEISFIQQEANDKNAFTDVFSKFRDIICKELDISKKHTPNSECSVDISSSKSQNRESKCKRSSPLKKKLPSPKRCRLSIERCDDLIKRYEIQNKTKNCFVSLERCDNLVQMYARKKTRETEFKDLDNHSGTQELTLINDLTTNTMENRTSSNLKRSDSYSILNDFDLFDQSGISLNIEFRTCKKYDDLEDCQSDWFMTKSKYYYLSKNGIDIRLIDDDVSTDCDSDLDTSINKAILGDDEPAEENILQIPSLLELTLKVLRNDTVLESLRYKDVRTSNNSTPLLKRKLSTLEYYTSDTKICKYNDLSPNSPENNLSHQDNIYTKEMNPVLNDMINDVKNMHNIQNRVDINQNAELNIEDHVLCYINATSKDIHDEERSVNPEDTNEKSITCTLQHIEPKSVEIENEFILERANVTQEIDKTDEKTLKENLSVAGEKSGLNENLLRKQDIINDSMPDVGSLQELPKETILKVESEENTKMKQDNVKLDTLLEQINTELEGISEEKQLGDHCESAREQMNLVKDDIQKDNHVNIISQHSHVEENDVCASKDVSNIKEPSDSKKDILEKHGVQSELLSNVLRLEEIVTKFVVNNFEQVISEPMEIPGSEINLFCKQQKNIQSLCVLEPIRMEEIAEENGATSVLPIEKGSEIQTALSEALNLKEDVITSINTLKPVNKDTEEISTMKQDLFSGSLQIEKKISSQQQRLDDVAHESVLKSSKKLNTKSEEASESKHDLRVCDEQDIMGIMVCNQLDLGEVKASADINIKMVSEKEPPNKETYVLPEVKDSIIQDVPKESEIVRLTINNEIDRIMVKDKTVLESSNIEVSLQKSLVGANIANDHDKIRPLVLLTETPAISVHPEQEKPKRGLEDCSLRTPSIDKKNSSKPYNLPDTTRQNIFNKNEHSNDRHENIKSNLGEVSSAIFKSKQNVLQADLKTELNDININSASQDTPNIIQHSNSEQSEKDNSFIKNDEIVTELETNLIMTERNKSMGLNKKYKNANTATDTENSVIVSKGNSAEINHVQNYETLNYLDKKLESLNKIAKSSVSDTCGKDIGKLEQVMDKFPKDIESDCQNKELEYKREREHTNLEVNVINNDENNVISCNISPFHQPMEEYIDDGDIMAEGLKSPESVIQRNNIGQQSSLENDEHASLEYNCDKNDEDVVEVNNGSKREVTQIPKNITLLYEGDSSVILKGSIVEDAIVGTCYVFPILNSEILNSVMHNSDQIENGIKQSNYLDLEESHSPKVLNKLIEDTELIVTKPKVTYSRISRTLRRGVKRKFENVDAKIVQKKYRKGKNIDYPKITVAAIYDCAYSKEFKKLSNYFSSIKFSYTKNYHLIHLQDVHTMLENWPIKELHLPAVMTSDNESNLFLEKTQKKISDPSRQTLAEEISANYDDDDDSSLDEINETNFSMGFGEGSGRVNLNFKNRREKTKFMAATLSDVKQFQPILQPTNKNYPQDILTSRQDQLQKLDKFYSTIKLRDKIRSYFKETEAILNNTLFEYNFKSTKDKSDADSWSDLTHSIFHCNISEFFEPPMTETVVQIVQIGQLPVSAAAQNPVTCDPRVTQVTDASLPQCSMENGSPDDMQANIKTEYTELTTADISLPIMPDYDHQHQTLIAASQVSNLPNGNDNITIETEVKIEVLDETHENIEDNSSYDGKDFPTFPSNQITNSDQYQFSENGMNAQVKSEPDLKIVLEPTDSNLDEDQVPESYKSPQQDQQNGSLEKPDQLAHAMNAAGITPSPEPTSEESAVDLSRTVSRSISEETEGNNYRPTIAPITLQQALSKILPQHLNQTNETESNSQTSVPSHLLHIVHGKNTPLNKITLADNPQQSVANTHPTPVFHIVQSKSSPSTSISNGSPPQNSNSFNGLSLVDTSISQGGNQLLHIVNANAQKSNTTPVLKRVNLVTNVTNAQGSCEQKMVQILCKSADAKGIQLNAHQRSMVLRLHPIETPPSTTSKPEAQDTVIANTDSSAKDVVTAPQVELKSRSVYEENYAKFIQDCNKQVPVEPSVTLPKFNQAFFGKPVFQENNQKTNDIDVQLPSVDSNEESNCQSNGHAFENTPQIGSPLLLRKTNQTAQPQQTLTQHVKQAITPMNIQTMHGGVIYTRQIPVNIGSGQTINLITVPSTERVDDSVPKQKPDVKFATRPEVEPSFIKIVPQTQVAANPEISTEENNAAGVSNENSQNPQPPPMLTQMRIKLPMLSKNTQMVSGARVVRPSFFQIQRNVIGGANQPVYQQLVLTAAPTLGPNAIRLPQMQTNQEMKESTENQTSSESEMSSSTLHEQLQEFDKIMEQVKERSTVQPSLDMSTPSADSTETPSSSTPTETTQQILYSIGNTQQLNVAYINRKPSSVSTTATTSFARSPDSSSNIESPSSSTHVPTTHVPRASTSETSNDSSPAQNNKPTKSSSKSKSRPKSHHPQFKFNHVPPKPSNQKPIEDEQTTQRILYILAEYKEQVENSPDKDKPAPRRRTNLQAGGVIAPGGSKSKKKRRNGRDSSPIDDNCRTMGSEDSSCGTSQGDCNEACLESNSPQGSPRKVAKKLSFEQEPSTTPRPQQPTRNVLVTDGPTIAVTRAAPGKPATAVLMPANYILPVSMVKSGQQIAIVTNRGPKILTLGGAEGGATNALLLQRLIGPAGLKPMLARPGIRHVRLPTAALQNLQAFNINTFPNATQPDAPAEAPVPASSPPQLVETKAPPSPWAAPEQEEVKPERESSPEEAEQEQEPWSVPQDYSYEETVRTEMDRTVLDAIPDRYSPDMEAERIFDKMFDVESKKDYIVESQDDSPHCPYDIDASDSDDRAYHQVVQRRDGVNNRHRFLSAATLRQKFALMEDELRLQKSLSEECEDLGVDSPSASDLFPEAELLFSSSPAHEASQQPHTPQPSMLGQSSVSPPDVEDQAATDHLISDGQPDKPGTEGIDLGLEDVGIVTVSEDGMRATISLDHEEFVRSHPNTTFHREPTDDGEVQPITIDDLKARHLTSTIFHAGRAPATVLVTAPQTTVISQATPDGSGVDHVRCSHADNLMPSAPPKDESLDRFDSLLSDSRDLHLPNPSSAIIHSTGNATQVIRRVCYEDRREEPRYLDDPDLMGGDAKMTDDRDMMDSGDVDDDRSSPERNAEMFWEMHSRARRLDFSSDSDKCCKSPYDENNSTDSSGIGAHMRLDSVIKDARVDRASADPMGVDDGLPPLRTYASKRVHEAHSKRGTDERYPDSGEGKRRASNRGVVKRGCHCCNGSPAPPKPKKPRHRKPHMDFN